MASLVPALFPPDADAARGLQTGFFDPVYASEEQAERQAALANSRAARASVVRIQVSWALISRSAPPDSASARNPAWERYSWGRLDRIVSDAVGAGMQPLLSFINTPAWAEGANRPKVTKRAPAGTWRPSDTAFRDFSEAVARRYSGSFPDPARLGVTLPRVRYFQAWNEPNLSTYLSPQWVRRKGRVDAVSPRHYRRLLNAFYDGVNAAHRSNLVISAGTAPFGEPKRGGLRMPPALFTRELLCVRGRARPRPAKCPGQPARFDALAHHPYALGSPRRRALNPDDVVMPDFHKLNRPLRVAVRSKRARPKRKKQLWVTEFSWDSRPPDPDGSPLRRHAQYVQQGLYTLWRQGVDVALYFQVRDAAEGRGYQYTYQSGVYFRGPSVAEDRPKPAFQAFRFPFSAFRKGGRVIIWGIAPRPGRVTIQARRRGGWTRLTRVRAGRNRVFVARRRVAKGTVLRARIPGESSLSFRVGPREKL